MKDEWDRPEQEEAGSLLAFGRRLRAQYGSVMAGLDTGMLGLLEKLFDIPFGKEQIEPAPTPPATLPPARPRRPAVIARDSLRRRSPRPRSSGGSSGPAGARRR